MKDIMDKIQQYVKLNEQLEAISEELEPIMLDKVIDVLLWKNKNTGGNYDVEAENVHYFYKLDFFKDGVILHVESSWAYGGHDDACYSVPYKQIFTEEWKDEAVKEYKEKLNEENRRLKEKAEAKERAEYERLKAKFEQNSEDHDDLAL